MDTAAARAAQLPARSGSRPKNRKRVGASGILEFAFYRYAYLFLKGEFQTLLEWTKLLKSAVSEAEFEVMLWRACKANTCGAVPLLNLKLVIVNH